MAKLPLIGLIMVPQPPISMARVSGRNTSVGARHRPLVFCDVKVNTRPFVGSKWSPLRHTRDNEPPDHPYRVSVPILESLLKGV